MPEDMVTVPADPREPYGRLVRETWVAWALEQPDVKDHPSWTKPWDDLSERDKEVDMRIGSAVAAQAVADAKVEGTRMRAQLMAFAAERDRAVRELRRRADRAVPGVERDTWIAAAAVVAGIQERGGEEGS